MKAEILQRLRQQASSGDGTLPSADMPKDASDISLSRQYLDGFESRSVCTFSNNNNNNNMMTASKAP